jgi:hypothetical protein
MREIINSQMNNPPHTHVDVTQKIPMTILFFFRAKSRILLEVCIVWDEESKLLLLEFFMPKLSEPFDLNLPDKRR